MHQNLLCKLHEKFFYYFGVCAFVWMCGQARGVCFVSLYIVYLTCVMFTSCSEEGAKGWLKQSQSFRDKQDSYTPRKENGSSLKTTYDHSKNVTLYVSGIPIGLSEVSPSWLFVRYF